MQLKEYVKIRGTRQLTAKEASIFGIDRKVKWLRRFKDLEITEDMAKMAAQSVLDDYSYLNRQVKGRLRKFLEPSHKTQDVDKKYLYLLINSQGNPKIGISRDPIQRARRITTSSGFITECVAYWDVDLYAKERESLILNKFRKYKTEGEWFIPNSLGIEAVERTLTVDYVRIYSRDVLKEVSRYVPKS